MKYSLLKKVAVISGLAVGAFTLSALADWTAPHSAPPTCVTTPGPSYDAGCLAPINVGTQAQVKNGDLSVQAFVANLKAYFVQSVGIGTQPTAGNALDVEGGPIKAGGGLIIPTGAALSKVLTSDAVGNATWQTPSGGGGGGVTKIIAGTNITINPVTGVGNVTINSTGAAPATEYNTCNGSSGAPAFCTAMCSAGKHVTGGGCQIPNGGGTVLGSSPTAAHDGWICRAGGSGGPINVVGTSICQ